MGAKARVINLHCDVCGTEIMVSASGDYKWHPIYCCGLEIRTEDAETPRKAPAAKKTVRKKTAKAGVPTRSVNPSGSKKAGASRTVRPAPKKKTVTRKTTAKSKKR